jgi:hypothetical protein
MRQQGQLVERKQVLRLGLTKRGTVKPRSSQGHEGS